MTDLDQYIHKDHRQYLSDPGDVKILKFKLKDGIDTETVGGVQDGDTITGDVYDLQGYLIESNVSIREGTVDTPETINRITQKKDPTLPSYPHGVLATEYLKEILHTSADNPSEVFLLERKYSDLPRDIYGRRTNPIITPDGKFVGPELLKKGLASLKYFGKYESSSLFNKKLFVNLYHENFKKETVSPTVKIDSSKEILDVAKKYGWVNDEGKNIDGTCKIGAVWLPVPPSQITITEVNENEVINTIRTPGNPKIKTGKQEIRIEMEIFFPSLYDVNTKFRPLLAQFIRTPFLPIENDHIKMIIMPDMLWSKPKIVTKKQKNEYSTDSRKYERTASKDMSSGYFTSFGDDFKNKVSNEYLTTIKSYKHSRKLAADTLNKKQENITGFQRYMRDTFISNIQDDSTKRRYEDIVKSIGISKLSHMDKRFINEYFIKYQNSINVEKVNTDIDAFFGDIHKLEAEIGSLTDKIRELKHEDVSISVLKNYKGPSHMYEDMQLAVALRDISVSTVPGYPEALQCNLTMGIFNYSPYSVDFSFLKDIEGALKQAEYNYRKLFLQYPSDIRKNFGVEHIYDEPIVNTTKNMSESEPFLSYISPLLTGETSFDNKTFKMKYDDGSKSNDMNRGFLFMPPRNWLRLVKNLIEFKSFDFEYEITDLSIDEREILDFESKNADVDVMGDIFKLLEGVGLEFNFLNGISNDLKFILMQLRKLISLETLQDRINESVEVLESYKESTYFNLKFDIPDRGSKTPAIKRDRYRVDKFRDMFAKLKGGGTTGDIIIAKIKRQFKVKNLSKYGYQNLYKFSFTEDEDTIITGVSAAMSNKLATIPLLSYTLPTFQHMGKNDWTIQISLQTCNMNFIRILRSLSIKASESRILRNKSGKSWWINKSNSLYFNPDSEANGFMKMLGINHALFQDFVYESMKEKPGWWNVTIRLSQSDMDLFLYESLLRVGFFKTDVLNDLQKELVKKYKWGDETVNSEYNHISRYIFSDMRNFTYRMVLNPFYGGDISETHNIPDEYVDEKNVDSLNVLFTDSEIESIIKSNLNAEHFKRLMMNKFDSIFNSQNGTFKPVHISNSTASIVTDQSKERRILLDGNTIYESDFKAKLNNIMHMNFYNVISLVGRKLLKASKAELDVGKIHHAVSKHFMRTTTIRAIISAPEESYKLIKYLKTKNGEIKYERKDINPVTNIPRENSSESYDLYSNYFDLNLPAYQGGLLSTPAGFFYTNYSGKDLIKLDVIKERINSTKDLYENAWKFHLLDGLAMYDILDSKGLLPFSITAAEIEEAKKLRTIIIARKAQIDTVTYRDMYLEETGKLEAPSISTAALESRYDSRKRKELNELTLEKLRLDKTINKGVSERKKLFEGGYDEIVKVSTKIAGEWQNVMINLDADKKKQLQATRSSYVIKQAMAIMTCLRLASIQTIIEGQEVDKLVSKIDGITSSQDRLLVMKQDLISQLQMLSETPVTSLYGVVTPWSLDNTKEIYDKVETSYNTMKAKDKTLSMERAYPTMKLYFIEEDDNSWGALDDYYLYNAIESVEIIKSKKAASSIANIIVTNASKNLTDPYATHRSEASLQEGTLEEQSVLSIYLREGTTIMVKAGFDNNSDGLDVIFYGKVVSNTSGDRMSIVAQGFGAELLEVVNKGVPKKLGYNSAARTHGDIVLWAANTLSGLQHFGSSSNLERLGLVSRHGSTPYYASSKSRTWDYLRRIHPIAGFYFRFAVYDPRFENVYLPFSKLALSPWTQTAANALVNFGKGALVGVGTLIAVGITITAVAALTVGTGGIVPIIGSAIVTGVKALAAKSITAAILLTLVSIGSGAYASSYFGNVIISLTSKNNIPLFWRSTFDWVVRTGDSAGRAPNMWALLNEISLYHNDCIVTTLPYNSMFIGRARETLYVGPRDGLYKYTDTFDSKENADKIVKDIQNKRRNMGLILDPKRRDNIKKRVEKAGKIINKYNKKLSKLEGGTIPEDETAAYNAAQKEISEWADTVVYIKRYEEENHMNEDNKVLETNKEYFVSNMIDNVNTLIKHDKINSDSAKEVIKNIRELTYSASQLTNDQWSKFLRDKGHNVAALEKIKLDSLMKHKESGTDRRWTRLDDVSYVLARKYKHLTMEEKNMQISSFESSGILLAIDNPTDLTVKKRILERNEEGILEERNKIVGKYPGYMNVVNYYHLDSFSHIIENNIRSSSEDIHNHVVVKYPADPTTKQVTSGFQTKEFWADDNIKGSNIRTYVSEQYNIDPLSVPLVPKDFEHWLEFRKRFLSRKLFGNMPRIYQVGYNILANQMRSMYRGELVVIGMPYLKPYDIVFVNDYHNKMWGPIEVETVKHRFDGNGFITEITPNAVINYMKPAKVAELGFMQGFKLPTPLGFLGNIVGFNLLTKIGAGTSGIGGISTAALVAWGGAGWMTASVLSGFGAAFALTLGMSLWNWGVGRFMGRDIINITGLWQGSMPMVAGMEGAYKDNISVHTADRIQSLLDIQVSLGLVE